MATSQAFRNFMREDSAYRDYLHYRIAGEYRLHSALNRAGFLWQPYLDPDSFHTIEPMLFEAEGVVDFGCPLVLRNIFTLDPLTSDMQAIDARGLIDKIRQRTDFDIRLIWESILPYYPLRLLQSNMDEMRNHRFRVAMGREGKLEFRRKGRGHRARFLHRHAG